MKMKFITALTLLAFTLNVYAANQAPTINWSKIPTKVIITTGISGAYSKLTTTKSTTYRGYFSGVADSSSGNLSRRMWFSTTPMGKPIETLFSIRGIKKNACDRTGVDLKLSWSQELKPAYVTTCKLNLNTTYYLNYTQSGFGTGSGPTPTSKMIRGSSKTGTP